MRGLVEQAELSIGDFLDLGVWALEENWGGQTIESCGVSRCAGVFRGRHVARDLRPVF